MATEVERSAASSSACASSASSSSAGRGASRLEAVLKLLTASNLAHLATVAGYCSLNITLNKCATREAHPQTLAFGLLSRLSMASPER